MLESKIVSVFDFGRTTAKFWTECSKDVLDSQGQLIEHEFLTAGKGTVKKVFLLLGVDYVYKVTQNKLKCAPLLTMHMNIIDPSADHFVQLNSDERLFGFKLQYQTKSLDIFTEDKKVYDYWRDQLRGICLKDNFHDAYMVSKLVGKGSFAKVYLATRKENNQQYAVKAFSKSFMLQQHKGIESLLNEMKIMRRIEHPNIVKLHEVHETANSVYFIIDMITGGELLQRVREQGTESLVQLGFLPVDVLQKFAFNLMSALAHLHSKNMVHRDLKPENLLLKSMDNAYDVILADFGLSACLTEDLLFKRCGTPGFVAPEILEYQEGQPLYDEKCDVFSAGVIFYILITGNQPFQGKDQKAILKSNKDCIVDYDDYLFKQAPAQFQDLVKQMLIKKASNRISSAEALKHGAFKEIMKEMLENQEQMIKNLGNYSTFQFNMRQGSQDTLIQNQPAYNGNTNTLDTISQTSNASFSRFEQKANSMVGASRFSQYSQKLTNQPSRDISDIPGIQKMDSKRQIDYHKMAIQNSHRKGLNLDQFEEVNQEVSEVSDMVKMYNSTRYIKIPEHLTKCTTPTNKK